MAQSNTGTCRYMAPERIDPSRSTGGGFRIQADVWSLGLTLLELATGKHPYENFVNQFELLKHVSYYTTLWIVLNEDISQYHKTFPIRVLWTMKCTIFKVV